MLRGPLRSWQPPEPILYAVVSGILGARIFYYFEFYKEHFADKPWYHMFFIWEGGIVFYGGLLFATIVILVYLKAKRLPVMNSSVP